LISPHASVRARNPETKEILAHGESGELEFVGPSLLIKYFEDDFATEELIRKDGYLKSGDLGYTCSASEFVFQARMGDTLRLGGYLVAPAEIENHLIEHDSVETAQVVAVRIHDKMRAYAFVIPAKNKTPKPEELKNYCLESLARFKVPAIFHCVAEFPTTKSPNGTKIQRTKLREIAEAAIQNQSES
jgi:fatty-acyl-CoA synthase